MEYGRRPVGYKSSVCLESDSGPLLSIFSLILSLREDRSQQHSQLASRSSSNAMASCFLTFTVTPTLFFPSVSAVQLELLLAHLSK